jgi:hypothetical protein
MVRDSLIEALTHEPLAKLERSVTPAKVGVQKCARNLDSRFRLGDRRILLQEAPIRDVYDEEILFLALSRGP